MTIKSSSKSAFRRAANKSDARTETEFRDAVASEISSEVRECEDSIASTVASLADLAENVDSLGADLSNVATDLSEVSAQVEANYTDLQNEFQSTIEDEISTVNATQLAGVNSLNSLVESVSSDVGEALLRLVDRHDLTMDVLRSASFEINPSEGTAIIRCVEDLRDDHGARLTSAESNINAQTATIALKASREELDEMASALISGAQPVVEYSFQSSTEGWTGTNATLTAETDYLDMDCSDAGAYIQIEGLSLAGSEAPIFSMHFKQSAGEGWGGKVQWKTASHGYSSAYEVELLGTSRDNFRVFQAGFNNETDWMDSTITGVRVYLGESSADEYQIKEISFGVSLLQQLLFAGIEARMTTAETWIDGANATITDIAEQVVIDGDYATNTEVSSAISAASGTLTDSLLSTHINPLGVRTTSVENRLDVTEGKITQTVSDIESSFEEAISAEALLSNLVFQDQQIEVEKEKLALAKSEIQAEVQDGLNAEALQRTTLATQIDSSLSGVTDTLESHATDITSLAEADTVLGARIEDANATIEDAKSTYIEGNLAEAQLLTIVGAETIAENGSNALAIAEETLRLESEAGRSALAEQVATLSASVDNTVSSIEQSLGCSVSDGVPRAWYTLVLDANGALCAIKAYADGSSETSTLDLAANAVRIVHPARGEPMALFLTDTGTMILNTAVIGSATIGGSKLEDNSISTNHLQANCVTANHLQANCVTASELAANSVTANAIAANSVTASKIAAGSITSSKLAANSVTANAIAAGAILAELAVIDTAYIENAHIKNLTVDKGKLAAGITRGYNLNGSYLGYGTESGVSSTLYLTQEYLAPGGRVLVMASVSGYGAPDDGDRCRGYVYLQYSYREAGGSWSSWENSGTALFSAYAHTWFDNVFGVTASRLYVTPNTQWRFRLVKTRDGGWFNVSDHSIVAILFHK